jgi:hypothetical protein
MAPKGLLRKILRNYFELNLKKGFPPKGLTASHVSFMASMGVLMKPSLSPCWPTSHV